MCDDHEPVLLIEDLDKAMPKEAVAYAQSHAAKLVTDVTSRQRNTLHNLIVDAVAKRQGIRSLVSRIANLFGWDFDRSARIAHYELKSAKQGGMMLKTRANRGTKRLMKQWYAGGEESCEDCQANEDAGPIELDDVFPSGHDTSPAHPFCDCDVDIFEADDDTV